MIDGNVAAKAVTKILIAFPRTEGEDEYQELMISVFREACSTAEHVSRTVTRVLRICKFRPTPADIYESAESTAAAAKESGAADVVNGKIVIVPLTPPTPQPGDEPFNGISDLVDDKLRARIKEILGPKTDARLKQIGAGK